nr:uncharacterized protein LOC124220021 [Neodiprion pinetum]
MDSKTRFSEEAAEEITNIDYYSPSGSVCAIQNTFDEFGTAADNVLIYGTNDVKCVDDCKESGILWNASLSIAQNHEIDTTAPAVPTLDFHHQMSNTAILIPERSLYVGIKQTYLLTLRNLTCKPVSYAWGLPPEKDGCRMEVYFNPKEGLIPPTDTAMIEVICLPTNTGVIEDLYIPCFVGGRQDPIMLGLQCTIDALFVTFLFLPPPNAIPSPCVDSIRVEWHKAGHTSALNLNNLKMNRHSKIEEEQELKNINLDAGQVIATTAVGPENVDIDNTSLVSSIENPSPPKKKLDAS